MYDINGRPYAKVCEVREGDTIEVDGDFTCMDQGTCHVVKFSTDDNSLYVECNDGRHLLDGQCEGLPEEDDDGNMPNENDRYYMGMYLVKEPS